MLIDSRLLNSFWAKAIKLAKYFQNKLPTKSKNYNEIIFKKF